MVKEKKVRKRYSYETKIEAVQRVIAGESIIDIAKDLDIKDSKRIYTWLSHYKKGQLDRLRDAREINELSQNNSKDQKIKQLEMENEILKKYLSNLDGR